MTDQFSTPSSIDDPTPSTKEAFNDLKSQVRSSTDRLVGESKRAFTDAKAVAAERVSQGRDLIEERPYQAIGVALLTGVILGHLMSSSRSQVIYLRDR